MKNNDWKAKLGVVYSTNPDFTRTEADDIVLDSVAPSKQTLRIEIDKKGRNGKSATLITGFMGSDTELKELAKRLKTSCGVGGSTRDGEILIQGDVRTKVDQLLRAEGYKTKLINGK
jgi:translation initiation factor 1